MIENPSVNRSLADKAFDRMDHALGRPMWPMRPTYRNYFATDADSIEAKAFDDSEFWAKSQSLAGMVCYLVTDAGRKALADHLAIYRLRVFEVTWDHHTQIIPALTASKAKYDYFLSVKEVCPDLKFVDFARDVRVRRAA